MRKYLFLILALVLSVSGPALSALAETPQQCTAQLEDVLAISGGFGSLSGNLQLIEDTEKKCYLPEIDSEYQCIQRINTYGWDSLIQTFSNGASQINSTKEDLILNCSSKFISTNITLETRGACSSHLGVNCQVGEDYDGSVICNDKYRDSSVLFALVEECKTGSNLGTIIMPDYSLDFPVIDNGSIISSMKDELSGFHDLNLKTINLMYDALMILGDYSLEIDRLSFKSEELLRKEVVDGGIFDQLLDNLSDLDKRHYAMSDAAIENITDLKDNLLNARNNLKFIKNDSYVTTAVSDIEATEKKYLGIIKESTNLWIRRKSESKVYIEKKRDDYLELQKNIVSKISTVTVQSVFSDITDGHFQVIPISFLKKRGIIQGYDDGMFKPLNTVNRAELMKILIGDALLGGEYRNCFKDVHEEWFAPYICYAKTNGWIEGYSDGTFKPAQVVNRAEAIKMAIEVFGLELSDIVNVNPYADIDKNSWFAPYVLVAKEANLLNVYENYQPGGGMARGDISDIIYRLLTLKELQEVKYDISLDIRMVDN